MRHSAIAVLVFLAFTGVSHAAEFTLTPSIGISEEYNDNIYDSAFDVKTDYVTHLMPGLALKYRTGFWDWNLNYLLDYRIYAKNSYNDQDVHNLNVNGLVTLLDNLLFLEIQENYRRVSTSVRQDFTKESDNLNQTDSNIITASPYITLKPASNLNAKLGLRFANYWYKDPGTIDKNEYGGFAKMDYEISPKLFMDGGYTFTHSEARQDPGFNNYDWHNVYVGPRYQYAEKSSIYGHGGYTFIDYASGQTVNNPFWDAGISHNFGTWQATVETRVAYQQDPEQNLTEVTSYSGTLEKTFARGTVGFSAGYFKYDYMNLSTEPDTDSYRAGMNVSYNLTSRLTGRLAFEAEEFHEKGQGNYTRYFVNPHLEYNLPYNIMASLDYIFVDYSSKNRAEYDRSGNRVIVQVSKVF